MVGSARRRDLSSRHSSGSARFYEAVVSALCVPSMLWCGGRTNSPTRVKPSRRPCRRSTTRYNQQTSGTPNTQSGQGDPGALATCTRSTFLQKTLASRVSLNPVRRWGESLEGREGWVREPSFRTGAQCTAHVTTRRWHPTTVLGQEGQELEGKSGMGKERGRYGTRACQPSHVGSAFFGVFAPSHCRCCRSIGPARVAAPEHAPSSIIRRGR